MSKNDFAAKWPENLARLNPASGDGPPAKAAI